MADMFTPERRSAMMALVRSSGNASTEQRLARLFRTHRLTGWRRGSPLPGKPDFIFRAAKVAVFVDRRFWHVCPRHATKPNTRAGYWAAKLARNVQRDRKVSRALRAAGWAVFRVWECALKRGRGERTVTRIARVLTRRAKSAIIRVAAR